MVRREIGPEEAELSKKAFQSGIERLRQGYIPENLSNIICRMRCHTTELIEYAEAMTECALRQSAQIQVYKEVIETGRQAGAIGKGGG